MMEMPTHINSSEVRRILNFDIVFSQLEETLANFSKHDKSICQPLRHIVDIPKHNGSV